MKAVDARPLGRHLQLVSQDVDEVREHVAQVFSNHELRLVDTRQALDTHFYYRPLRHIGLGRLRYGATVDIDPGALDRFYLMQWPLHGAETIHACSAQVDSSPEVGTLISPSQRFYMRHQGDADKLFVRIERGALERLARQLAPGHPHAELAFEPALPLTSPALKSLKALLDWLFQEASCGTLLDQPLLAEQIEETLLLTMLQVLPHNRPELLRGRPAVTPGFVLRAEEYMASQAAEALTVSRIAAQAGTSIRSLYAGFQRYRGCSPMDHLRDLRLARAHAELSHPTNQETTVTQVALRCGFGHLGQFAAAYRLRYGELPSQTLRRARS